MDGYGYNGRRGPPPPFYDRGMSPFPQGSRGRPVYPPANPAMPPGRYGERNPPDYYWQGPPSRRMERVARVPPDTFYMDRPGYRTIEGPPRDYPRSLDWGREDMYEYNHGRMMPVPAESRRPPPYQSQRRGAMDFRRGEIYNRAGPAMIPAERGLNRRADMAERAPMVPVSDRSRRQVDQKRYKLDDSHQRIDAIPIAPVRDNLQEQKADEGSKLDDSYQRTAAAPIAPAGDSSQEQKADRNSKVNAELLNKDQRLKGEKASEKEEIDPLDQFLSTIGTLERVSVPPNPKVDWRLRIQNSVPKKKGDSESLLSTIPVVDHSLIDYPPFEKSLYVVPKELMDIDVDSIRTRNSISVNYSDSKYRNLLITEFHHAALPEEISNSLMEQFGTDCRPTPIQMQAIPAILSGLNFVGIAPTGSGKTLAFILPLFRRVLAEKPVGRSEGMIGLVLTPTRELTLQIQNEIEKITGDARRSRIRSVAIYGGALISDQIARIKQGVEIVVATPGRFIELAYKRKIISFKRCNYVVIDEADRMFDMGFKKQILAIIRNIRPDRQVSLFSATYPASVEKFVRKHVIKGTDYMECKVGSPRGSVNADVIQKVVAVDSLQDKQVKLLKILGEHFIVEKGKKVVIFTRRKERTESLLKFLFDQGYSSFAIHSGMDQADRDSIVEDFRNGISNILIATELVARGLDIEDLDLVVNFDCPQSKEDYIHRVGRTGRAGKVGKAVTFILKDKEAEMARELYSIVKFDMKDFEIPPKSSKKKKYKQKGFDFSGKERTEFKSKRESLL